MATPREEYNLDPSGADDFTAEYYFPASKVTVPGGLISDVGINKDQLKAIVNNPAFVDRRTTPVSATSLTKTEVARIIVPAGFGDNSLFQIYSTSGDAAGAPTDKLTCWLDIEQPGGGGTRNIMNVQTNGDQTLSRLSFFSIGVAGFAYTALPAATALLL